MLLDNFIYNITKPIRGFLKRWGTSSVKQAIWDYENKTRKEFLHENVDEKYRSRINDWIERYCHEGDILDLGCSDAHIGYSLNSDLYSTYTGVDLSKISIDAAINRQNKTGGWRLNKNRHVVHDISNYPIDHNMNVILFKDSLYYINKNELLNVLKYYQKKLKSGGVFIVHMDNIQRHEWIRKIIKENFTIIEENSKLDPTGVMLIFR
jgi:2-polyprenyl-3-methyl-5-hydroxy-6-metoxy-1,4-benzoquinol methylase